MNNAIRNEVPSVAKTVVLHVVAVAGLACGAISGAWVARESAESVRRTQVVAAPESATDDGESAATCVLPGVRKPGQRSCV